MVESQPTALTTWLHPPYHILTSIISTKTTLSLDLIKKILENRKIMVEKTFFLNGHEFYISEDRTISDILNYFNYQNCLFVIEYNNLICDQNEWSHIKINSKDKIEIITIVGGG